MATGPTLGQARASSPDWTSLRRAVLDGGYQIEELLEADATVATFTGRVLADSSISAVVTVVEAHGGGGEEQVALWESLKQLRNANLNTPLAAGRTGAGDRQFVYVVWRQPEEKLSDALQRRALTAGEAGELLESIAPALEYLHSRGFVHGCLSPAEVFALGDFIVLSTVGARRTGSPPPVEWTNPKYTAPENGAQNVTPAADVWCLGATLFEVLTQRTCDSHGRDEAGQLPPPFNRIVERCLDPDSETRSKLVELQALYAAAMEANGVERRSAPVRQPSPSLTRVQPSLERSSLERPQTEGRALLGERQFRSARAWIYGLALLVLLLVIWLARPKHPAQRALPPGNSETIVQKGTNVPKGQAAWPTRTIAPDGTTATAPVTQPPAVAATRARPNETLARSSEHQTRNELPTVNGPIWRVVLYTYALSKDAENSAHFLNTKYPALKAETFSPNGSRGPFLVIAGGPMDRDDAVRLREKVLRMGLPHDTYIQNYKQ